MRRDPPYGAGAGRMKVPASAKATMDRETKRLILGLLRIFCGALALTGLLTLGLVFGFLGLLKLL